MSSPPDEFERSVIAARPKLKAFAVSLCRDNVRADDLVQETMLRAILARDSFAPGTKIEAWLFTILRNYFRSAIRRTKREVEDPDSAFAAAQPIEDDPTKRMEAEHMLDLVSKLPPAFGVPLRMIADGATYEEIAAEMHEHVGTIKSRVNRARQMIGAGLPKPLKQEAFEL